MAKSSATQRPAALLARTEQLLRGTPGAAQAWIAARSLAASAEALLLIALAGGAFGFSMGAWRAGEMALYCAIKLPLLLCSTALVNGLINGLLARRLGLDLSIAESLRAVLLSFALAAIVLAGLAPIFLFFDRTLPGPYARDAWTGHNILGLFHVLAVSVAGSVAVLRQRRWMRERYPKTAQTQRVVWVWLALNLFVGAQLSWNLRPWFGSPGLPVEFLREDPFDGTFYESVFQMARMRRH